MMTAEVTTRERLRVIADEELAAGGEAFMNWPDRWYEEPGPKWRRPNGHVSSRYLKSEEKGGDVCLACFDFLDLTFPEDKDGPLS